MFDPVSALVSGVVTGGLDLLGASQSADAQESAAQTTADANTAAAQLQYQEWLQQQANMQPWLTAGTSAINTLSSDLSSGGKFSSIPSFSFDATQIANNPDYQFVKQQSIDAANAQNAATGNYGSGTAASALATLGAGLASEYENQYYNQALNTYNANLNSQYTMPYNMLAGVAGTGQTAANSLVSTGSSAASNIGNYGVSSANALASGTTGAANAYTSALNDLTNNIMSGYSSYLSNQNQQDLFNALASQNGYGWV